MSAPADEQTRAGSDGQPAVSPPADAPQSVGTSSWAYDRARRKRAVRKGRERGCWVYVAMDELVAAGFDPADDPPWYRTFGHKRSRNAGSVIVSLYRTP